TDFFKSALYKKISFLDAEDCSQLITKPVEGVLEYEQGAVQRINEVTAGHPYFTQLVCHELFSVCQKTGVRVIQRPDVDAVLVSVIERGTVNLKFAWDEAGDLEKWVLACLARSPECSDPAVLTQTLRTQRVRFSEHDLVAALVHMREKDVLTENNHFVVELLRLWMRQNRPLERVREELVEVSPIANRYIEIGEEYWEQGQRENALESFRQALEVDPGNIKARVSVGTLLLETAEYEAAVSAFENALALDGEDIAALGGFCKAQLALGDRARDEGKSYRAIEFYQAVLAINPEHSAARERLGVIYRQQAEAKLSAGQDEAALLAFRTALGYLPEDEELTNRVQQVMDEKQAKAIAALTLRSDEAQAGGDWEAAIAAMQDALALAGRDEALEKKLAGVKVSQRAYLLATLPDQARRQEKDEAWEKAIATWQSYLALYPEDQGAAKAALDKVQQMGAIQAKYTQAQAALEGKDYDQAIELLQQVVQVDPGYKDASRLLASAVGASRRKQVNLLRWGWYALPILFILITAGAFFGLRGRVKLPAIAFQGATATPETIETLSMNLASLTPTPIPAIAFQRAPATPTATETISTNLASSTPTPSPSLTPYPEWVTDFAEPLMAKIEGQPPQFEDDFSIYKTNWNVPQWKNVNWVDGILDLGSWNDEHGIAQLDFDATDYIAQLQFKHVEDRGSLYFKIFLSENNYIYFTLQNEYYYFFHSGGSADPWYLGGKRYWGGMNLPRDLTIIRKDEKLAVYLDGLPMDAVSNIPVEKTDFSLGVTSGNGTVEVDNLRLWDLSALEDVQSTQDAITSSPSPTPNQEWVMEFAEPLLAEIEGKSPQFEDDFSIPIQEPGYLMVNGQDADVSEYITDDGKLELEGKLEMALGSQQFKAHDFALQYEAELYNTKNLAEMGIDIFDGLYVFHFNPNSGNWAIKFTGHGLGVPDLDTGRIKDEIGTRVEILLLVKAEGIAVYLNGEPITFVQVLWDVENDINQIFISTYGEQFHAS
ncbi:MAG: tetratricopeptide repeat protein, partial [Anaerolineales bacterium]